MSAPRPTLRFRLVAWLVIGLARLARWRIDVEGLEHVPRAGGAVIAWNHHSHVDFLATAFDIYRRLDRPVRFLAKREVWGWRMLGWVPRFAEAVPVDPGAAAGHGGALDAAVEALRDGHIIMVAPEGTISRSFELLPLRTGAARMAQAADVPLVPSVSWGSHRLVTTGHPLRLRRAWRLPVTVRFAAPVPMGPDDDPVDVTGRLAERMRAMLRDVQRRYPDGAPAGVWWVPHRLGGAAPRHEDVLRERGVTDPALTVAPPAPNTTGGDPPGRPDALRPDGVPPAADAPADDPPVDDAPVDDPAADDAPPTNEVPRAAS